MMRAKVKLPAHSAGLPGNDLLFDIVPLHPTHRAGLAGHAPVNWAMCTGDSAIPAALLKIAMEGEDGNSTQIAESTFQDRSINRRRTSGRTAKRRNWPRVQNRRSLDVKDVVQYVK